MAAGLAGAFPVPRAVRVPRPVPVPLPLRLSLPVTGPLPLSMSVLAVLLCALPVRFRRTRGGRPRNRHGPGRPTSAAGAPALRRAPVLRRAAGARPAAGRPPRLSARRTRRRTAACAPPAHARVQGAPAAATGAGTAALAPARTRRPALGRTGQFALHLLRVHDHRCLGGSGALRCGGFALVAGPCRAPEVVIAHDRADDHTGERERHGDQGRHGQRDAPSCFHSVPRAGFEPAAYSLGGSRSIQLSYRGGSGHDSPTRRRKEVRGPARRPLHHRGGPRRSRPCSRRARSA